MHQTVQRFERPVIKRPWLVVTAGVLILALWILPPVLFWLFDLQLDHPVLAGVLWIICGYPFALIVLMKNRYVVEIDEIRGVLTVETFNLLLHKSVRSVPFGDIDSVQFTLDSGRHRFRTERGRHNLLHVANHQSVAGKLAAIRLDVEVVATDDALGDGARRSRGGLHLRHALSLKPS